MSECKHPVVTKILENGQTSMAGYCVCVNCGKQLPDERWSAMVEKMIIEQKNQTKKLWDSLDKMLSIIADLRVDLDQLQEQKDDNEA